jgi:osomolarity two-component system response regulator SSK1
MLGEILRKIWIKRPGASATLIQINETSLVDEMREVILRKYANSLGRILDAPDISLWIAPRDNSSGHAEPRLLRPEEDICMVVDGYYPDGQMVHEALIVFVPPNYAIQASPDDTKYTRLSMSRQNRRPMEMTSSDFLLMPTWTNSESRISSIPREYFSSLRQSFAIDEELRPEFVPVFNNSSSPQEIDKNRSCGRERSIAKYRNVTASSLPVESSTENRAMDTGTPYPEVQSQSSQTPGRARSETLTDKADLMVCLPINIQSFAAEEKDFNSQVYHTNLTSRLDRRTQSFKQHGSREEDESRPQVHKSPDSSSVGMSSKHVLGDFIPPISVLIVEDNSINLRILQTMMQKLAIRAQTAVNGQIAVEKWKTGGFHLVLMDIQMPVMNGLQATREIRRLERINKIGVVSPASISSSMTATTDTMTPCTDRSSELDSGTKRQEHVPGDMLQIGSDLFKSPTIIVALTASSLHSDREEALAAGCNDFLTKPVAPVWMQQKIKEWGCMQALIDFDGWRDWENPVQAEQM